MIKPGEYEKEVKIRAKALAKKIWEENCPIDAEDTVLQLDTLLNACNFIRKCILEAADKEEASIKKEKKEKKEWN